MFPMCHPLRPFTCYVRPELLVALREAAKGEGRTLSGYVARVLDEYWDEKFVGEKLTEG